MRPSTQVSDAQHGFEESPHRPRNVQTELLWARLDPSRSGELDYKALQKGFRKIDHPMKDADEMLKKILKEVDTNGDGKIQFEEFQAFVQRADRQLFELFHDMDRDGNGKLDVYELQAAFKKAGLSVSNRKLASFFDDLDRNNDGYVSFDEWRDFLLFMPAREHGSQLHAVISYYYSVVNVTPEGDSIVSEETLEGLGSAIHHPEPRQKSSTVVAPVSHTDALPRSQQRMDTAEVMSPAAVDAMLVTGETRQTVVAGVGTQHVVDNTSAALDEESSIAAAAKTKKKFKLTDFVPDPGYFLAGAAAGGVSRTATAPFDRLKVYLLVNTNARDSEAIASVLRQAKPLSIFQRVTKPLTDGIRDIYRSGGFKGFFAGNGLNVVKIMPETAIKFGSYEAAKRALANLEGHDDPKQLSSISKFTAGGCAGMIAQFFVYPLDTLKFRLQCETVEGGLSGGALVRQTAVKMYADGGLRACYRGVTMGLVGMFPYSAIDMGMFELLKKTYRTTYAKYSGCHEDDANPGNIATGLIGATSGAIGASVVYPLNVVRTRLQTQGTVMHRATYTGVWDVTQKTIQREGWRGLYKGLTPNLLKVAPALSITWVVYENSKKLLGLT